MKSQKSVKGGPDGADLNTDKIGHFKKTSQESQMLSSVRIKCQVTKIVMNPGSQLSVL